MSALSTRLQLQVFSFPWQGAREKTQTSVNPRQGCPKQPPARWPMEVSVHLCHVLSPTMLDGLHSGDIFTCNCMRADLRPFGPVVSEVHRQISHKYHEKQWLQSSIDRTEITPKATGLLSVRLQIRAPFLLSKYILFSF